MHRENVVRKFLIHLALNQEQLSANKAKRSDMFKHIAMAGMVEDGGDDTVDEIQIANILNGPSDNDCDRGRDPEEEEEKGKKSTHRTIGGKSRLNALYSTCQFDDPEVNFGKALYLPRNHPYFSYASSPCGGHAEEASEKHTPEKKGHKHS